MDDKFRRMFERDPIRSLGRDMRPPEARGPGPEKYSNIRDAGGQLQTENLRQGEKAPSGKKKGKKWAGDSVDNTTKELRQRRKAAERRRRLLESTGPTDPVIVVLKGESDSAISYSKDGGATWADSDFSAALVTNPRRVAGIAQHPVTGIWYGTIYQNVIGTSEAIIASSGPDLATCTWSDVTGSPSPGYDFHDGIGQYAGNHVIANPVFNTVCGLSHEEDATEGSFWVNSSGALAQADWVGQANGDGFRMYNCGIPNVEAINPATGMMLVCGYRDPLGATNMNHLWSADGGATWDHDNDLAAMLGTSGCCFDPFTERWILLDDGGQELSWVAAANEGASNAAGNWNNVGTGVGLNDLGHAYLTYNKLTNDGQLVAVNFLGDIWTADNTSYNAWTLVMDAGANGFANFLGIFWHPVEETYYAWGTAGGDGRLYKADNTDTTLGTWSYVEGSLDLNHSYDQAYLGYSAGF